MQNIDSMNFKDMAKLKNNVSPTYGSIFRAIEERADECKFGPGFVATQITLTGNCDFQPLYVKVEDCIPETAPYEYHDADFFIDSDTVVMADILNGKKSFYDAVAEGSVTVNGDAAKAIVFVHTFF